MACCVARRPKSSTADGIDGLDSPAGPKKKPPPGISYANPAWRSLVYDEEVHPGEPAPLSAAPLLQKRFTNRDLNSLAREHEGAPEPLFGPAAQRVAALHVEDGWQPEVVDQFRQNELLCQQIFGRNWDPRYGRSRVRSAETGELICWGDGETYVDSEIADAPLADGALLRNTLREGAYSLNHGGHLGDDKPKSSLLPPSVTVGKKHLNGHPAGAHLLHNGDAYYRWMSEDAKGVDAGSL